MGIDILKLDEADILSALGDGDWIIALPENYPDVTIASVWRQQIISDAACQFVRWVLDGEYVEITHDFDPTWDHSGMARSYKADPLELLTRHSYLQEWLNEEFTGNSRASFMSGMGLFWDTYHDEVSQDIDEQVFELLKAQLQSLLDYPEDDDMWMEIWDEVTWVQSALVRAILLQLGQLSTADAWQRFLPQTRAQIMEEQRQAAIRAERYARMREQVQHFWHTHFADLNDQQIDKPQFKFLALAHRLREIVADTDPDIVEAIAEIGLPGHFSNSVRMEIQKIARKALTD